MGAAIVFMLGVAGVGAFGALIVLMAKASRDQWLAALTAVQKRLGGELVIDAGKWYRSPTLSGTVGDHTVVIDTYTVDKSTYTRIKVRGGLSHRISFEKERMLASIKKVFMGPDVEVGDPHFDATVVARGHALTLACALDNEGRRAVASAIADYEVQMNKGELVFTKSGMEKDPDVLIAAARAMLRMAEAVSSGVRVSPERLWEIARRDTSPGVRDRCLWHLITAFEGSDVAARALEHALADMTDEAALIDGLLAPQPGRRLAAVVALEARGTAAAVMPLTGIAESRADGLAPRARHAIAAIQERLGGARGSLTVVAPEPAAGALALGLADQAHAGSVSVSEATPAAGEAPPEWEDA